MDQYCRNLQLNSGGGASSGGINRDNSSGGSGGSLGLWSSGSSGGVISNCGGTQMCHHGHGSGPGPPNVIPPPPQPPSNNGDGISGICHGFSTLSLAGHAHNCSSNMVVPPPPPTLCNPCSSTSLNSIAPIQPTTPSSRWGPRTSCPIHSPFRVRVPNGSICSGHQVSYIEKKNLKKNIKV